MSNMNLVNWCVLWSRTKIVKGEWLLMRFVTNLSHFFQIDLFNPVCNRLENWIYGSQKGYVASLQFGPEYNWIPRIHSQIPRYLSGNLSIFEPFLTTLLGLLVNVKGAPFYFRLNQELIGHYYQQKSKLWYKINGVSKSNQTLLLRNVMVHYDHNRNNEFASCKGLKNLGSVTQEPPTNTTFWQ